MTLSSKRSKEGEPLSTTFCPEPQIHRELEQSRPVLVPENTMESIKQRNAIGHSNAAGSWTLIGCLTSPLSHTKYMWFHGGIGIVGYSSEREGQGQRLGERETSLSEAKGGQPLHSLEGFRPLGFPSRDEWAMRKRPFCPSLFLFFLSEPMGVLSSRRSLR